MSSSEIANTGPNNGRDRNNEFDFASGIRENSMLGNCIQAIDLNCICPCQETQLQDLNLTEMCTSAHFSESELNGGELIPAKPDIVVDEHYKDASWAYLTDEAEKDYVLETMASCGPTTVSRHVHGKGPLTQCLRTTTLESTVIATTSIFVTWLAILTSSILLQLWSINISGQGMPKKGPLPLWSEVMSLAADVKRTNIS
ncbi:hypothetical protein Bpfe_017293 [Biomphalaria pfeifferi]|uniref:Uncharacterized protein n=1 Tax=Biomphalaria pfeifferi TaxID=112525 RepID=A0AAD8BFL7_BIOPF|nr:hypothetical protein Bpfe_017293 [Biomphalaria pfeifferi]